MGTQTFSAFRLYPLGDRYRVIPHSCILPSLGSWLITSYGTHTVLNGQEAFVPTSLIFQVSAFATIFAAIPLFLIHTKKNQLEKVS